MERKTDPNHPNKLQFLQHIESEAQALWTRMGVGQSDAPAEMPLLEEPKKKFFTCFSYPYMNGRLHLGHTFTVSKCEFAVRFMKMQGYDILFPFAFHCSGMPILACADSLKKELDRFGNPPCFPKQDEKNVSRDKGNLRTFNWQWNIMLTIGVDALEIPKFTDASHWIDYFPQLTMTDLKRMGIYVDWRRSFITTARNPYYDSFIRWQFNMLKAKGRIKFGKRYTIFSPKDNQPCLDHDRYTGEGAVAQEFILIKLKMQKPYLQAFSAYNDKELSLVSATMCPETMYGLTNCWLHPDFEYVLVETVEHGMFLCNERCVRNLAYQNFFGDKVEYTILQKFSGSEILGSALKAPLTKYETIYALPMLDFVNSTDGTGILISVPSDSPGDLAALNDLKNNASLRDMYGITEENVSFDPVFYCTDDGVMITGSQIGRKIQDGRKDIQKELVRSGDAVVYMEPEQLVISRSLDECVVALCDQWYLDYGNAEWKAHSQEVLASMTFYHDNVKKALGTAMDRQQEHACSRTYGIGTKLPWDQKWLIESLSDSTIYMAFYTVKHILQGTEVLNHDGPIKAEYLTDAVWNYIFLSDAPCPKDSKIGQSVLDKARREFQFWYPVDLRVTGRDLVQNHLVYYIYNHAAMWSNEKNKWPVGVRTNGYLLLNSEKMAKTTGNFMTLSGTLDRFGADAMRFALANSGDSTEDANFVPAVAESAISLLFDFVHWAKEASENIRAYRDSNVLDSHEPNDVLMLQKLQDLLNTTKGFYQQLLFKECLKTGFFDMQARLNSYRQDVGGEYKMRRDIVASFIEFQIITLLPICPHVGQYVWTHVLGKESTIDSVLWPETPS